MMILSTNALILPIFQHEIILNLVESAKKFWRQLWEELLNIEKQQN
jgi:hypothetical protein